MFLVILVLLCFLCASVAKNLPYNFNFLRTSSTIF
jgi:hypothetical protein